MAASTQKMNQPVYQLKVTLKDSRPPIWRRFQVPGDTTLHGLHLILQVVMGWTNSHLYRFEIGGTQFGEPDPENEFYGLKFKNSKSTKLSGVASSEKTRFIYEYDFGDSWEHEVLIEKILPAKPGRRYPVCLAGKRACPPEDCGGIWGYTHLLEVIKDPMHEEYEEITEWLGGESDPERLDLEEINHRLKPILPTSEQAVPKGVAKPDASIEAGRSHEAIHPSPMSRSGTKIGRNDPCPCGSGKKYKKCCGR